MTFERKSILASHAFREKVQDLVGYCNTFYVIDEQSIEIELDNSAPDFDRLCKLSEWLQTTTISFWSYEEGSCPTCGSEIVTKLTISNIPTETMKHWKLID